jgi:hypothetical protein
MPAFNSKRPFQIKRIFRGALFIRNDDTIKEEIASSTMPIIMIEDFVFLYSSMKKNLGSYNLSSFRTSLYRSLSGLTPVSNTKYYEYDPQMTMFIAKVEIKVRFDHNLDEFIKKPKKGLNLKNSLRVSSCFIVFTIFSVSFIKLVILDFAVDLFTTSWKSFFKSFGNK